MAPETKKGAAQVKTERLSSIKTTNDTMLPQGAADSYPVAKASSSCCWPSALRSPFIRLEYSGNILLLVILPWFLITERQNLQKSRNGNKRSPTQKTSPGQGSRRRPGIQPSSDLPPDQTGRHPKHSDRWNDPGPPGRPRPDARRGRQCVVFRNCWSKS